MSKRKRNLIATIIAAIGGLILSWEKLLFRLPGWLTARDDIGQYVIPHVAPLLRRLAEPMPALDIAAWVLVCGGIASLVWINFGEAISGAWRRI